MRIAARRFHYNVHATLNVTRVLSGLEADYIARLSKLLLQEIAEIDDCAVTLPKELAAALRFGYRLS